MRKLNERYLIIDKSLSTIFNESRTLNETTIHESINDRFIHWNISSWFVRQSMHSLTDTVLFMNLTRSINKRKVEMKIFRNMRLFSAVDEMYCKLFLMNWSSAIIMCLYRCARVDFTHSCFSIHYDRCFYILSIIVLFRFGSFL
jgi:hypothetical protein